MKDQPRLALVNSYLDVLGLRGREFNKAFVSDLIARHVATFPFSSVGCRLGDELPLDFEALFDRIVIRRRGGYCFEQNGLVFGVLEHLGFSPELFLGRVIYGQDVHPGLTHRISTVKFDGQRFVVDVGFGPLGPRIPVPISGVASSDGEKVFRVAECRPGEYHMQVLKEGEFFSLYRFELSRYGQADCELGHFYSHRHPRATFVNHLVVSRILAEEVRSLRDLDYWVIGKSGSQNTQITDAIQLFRILVDELGVNLSEDESRRLYAASTQPGRHNT